ncbi:MAG: hypothetical protein IPK50_06745 [Fibrobacterota bacterium]|nr:MAG: hypothetical protein IPK50_06745 [Fibrobacterota bacterium]
MIYLTMLTVILELASAKPVVPHSSKEIVPVKPAIDSSDPLSVLEAQMPIVRTDWGRMDAGPYYVHNNVWNKAGVSRYFQAVGIKPLSDGGVSAGWAWRWPETNRVMAFPELVMGKNPWAAASSHPNLPVQLGEIDRFVVDLDLLHEGWGVRGTALQIWLTDDSVAEPQRIRHELMVWLRNDGVPVKGWMADLEIGGAKYTLADDPDLGMDLKWKVFSLFRAEALEKGQLDLMPIFDYLVKKGLIDKKEWVASVHLGTEIRGGSGLTRVKRFKLDLASRTTSQH